jgi:hypothetical protein
MLMLEKGDGPATEGQLSRPDFAILVSIGVECNFCRARLRFFCFSPPGQSWYGSVLLGCSFAVHLRRYRGCPAVARTLAILLLPWLLLTTRRTLWEKKKASLSKGGGDLHFLLASLLTDPCRVVCVPGRARGTMALTSSACQGTSKIDWRRRYMTRYLLRLLLANAYGYAGRIVSSSLF